jgi:hypothetical protein
MYAIVALTIRAAGRNQQRIERYFLGQKAFTCCRPLHAPGMTMNTYTFMLIMALLLFVQACSSETVKRTSFETLQNMREQQCEKDLSGNCPKRLSYDDYQRKIKQAPAPENGNKAIPSLPSN